MSSMTRDYKHSEITELIIKAFYDVYNSLGYGFLEKVYENALSIELREQDIKVEQQASIKVNYGDKVVGEYFADLIIQNSIIVEIKAARQLAVEHEAQLLNYLKATHFEVGLLLNFGPKPEIKRKAFDNSRKGSMFFNKM